MKKIVKVVAVVVIAMLVAFGPSIINGFMKGYHSSVYHMSEETSKDDWYAWCESRGIGKYGVAAFERDENGNIVKGYMYDESGKLLGTVIYDK